MNTRLAVVIPTHKELLDAYEERAIDICVKKLTNIDKFIVFPKSRVLNVDYYDKKWPGCFKYVFNEIWSKEFVDYSNMFLSPKFYEGFEEYDYILIYHTDSVMLGNVVELFDFIDKGYDYYGAPLTAVFPNGIEVSRCSMPERLIDFCKKKVGLMSPLYVGNGGFCLRKIDTTINVLYKYQSKIRRWFPDVYDDIVLSWLAQYDKEYRTCTNEMAQRFCVDCVFQEEKMAGVFAVHGKFVLEKSFWDWYELSKGDQSI